MIVHGTVHSYSPVHAAMVGSKRAGTYDRSEPRLMAGPRHRASYSATAHSVISPMIVVASPVAASDPAPPPDVGELHQLPLLLRDHRAADFRRERLVRGGRGCQRLLVDVRPARTGHRLRPVWAGIGHVSPWHQIYRARVAGGPQNLRSDRRSALIRRLQPALPIAGASGPPRSRRGTARRG